MAYSKKEGLSYIDDIPVKISERFRPPRKTTLPLTFRPHCSLDVLGAEYDFQLEERVLKWTEQRHQEQEALAKAKVEKIACEIEKFTKPSDTSATKEEATCATKEVKGKQAHGAELPQGIVCNPVVANLEANTILQPQLITQHPVANGTSIGTERKPLNLADFESETCNPFDYMELKTINDLEELNTVFQGMSVTAAPKTSAATSTWNYTETLAISQCASSSANTSSMSMCPVNNSYYSYFSPMSTEGDSIVSSHPTDGSRHLSEAANARYPMHPELFNAFSGTSVQHSIPASHNCNEQAKRGDFPSVPCCSAPVPSVLPSLPLSSFSYAAMPSAFGDLSRVSMYQNAFSPAGTHNSYLENSREASLSTPLKLPTFSGFVDAQHYPSSATKLRSSKSASDLRNLSYDFGVTTSPKRIWRSNTPPPHHTIMERGTDKSSTYSEPAASELGTKSLSLSIGRRPANFLQQSNVTTANNLPIRLDSSSAFNATDQWLVNGIADMGFPTDRVSRAVKHLGNDDKKVIDFLCQLQRLEETGYNLHDAEAALSMHNTAEEAKKFLDTMLKFQDLGFEKEAIKKALILHNNDRDKALDTLLL